MKLGIIYAAYIGKYGYAAGLERMKRHGYNSVDYQLFIRTHEGYLFLSESELEKTARADGARIEAAGIKISQTHGPWRWPVNDSTSEERKKRFDFFAKAVRGTAYAGAKNCVVHCIMPFGDNTDERREEMLAINEDFFGRLCEVGAEYGVNVCLENLPFPKLPLARVKDVVDFVKKVNHNNFKVCLDTGHALVCGEEIGDAVRYIGKELLSTLHVHDNFGVDDLHLHPGAGILDFDSLGRGLSDIRFEGAFSYETHVKGDGHSPEEQEKKEIVLADFGREFVKKYSRA